ncbi:MAG: TetR/AcrR family transcriptional regulator [Oscillospiraceae bacterium]|nr:TetR/AcrR family transcriptional regulator [Oscillospiraceae bacterium]
MEKKVNNRIKILNAAWKLFEEKGYEETTVDEIIEDTNTSKGTFYHYFKSKEDLLSLFSYIFDERYEELSKKLDVDMNSFDKLMVLCDECFSTIENDYSLELVARMYSSHLFSKNSKHLLDKNRIYYKLLRNVIAEGQQRGHIRDDLSPAEIIKAYTIAERGLIYDWCVCNGEYSLRDYGCKMMKMYLVQIKETE